MKNYEYEIEYIKKQNETDSQNKEHLKVILDMLNQ